MRRACISAAPGRRAPQAPVIRIMTEAEAFATLKEEDHLIYERLNALEELLSRTQNNTLPPPPPSAPPVPTLERLGSTSNLPPPPELSLQFKETKIGESPTFSGKVSEFHSLLSQCQLYICTKTPTFCANKIRIMFIIFHLHCGPEEWAHALLKS